MSNVSEQKCPCCGGAVSFDVDSQNLKCPYCDTEFDIASVQQAEEVRKDEVEDSIQWNTQSNGWGDGETDGVMTYSCNSCGGEIIADETTGATNCPYCGNPVVVKGKFSDEFRPDLVIPFKLDKRAAKEALKRHVSNKSFVPALFKSENHIDEIKGVYVPYWLFSCDAQSSANYRAETIRTWRDSRYEYTETSFFDVFRSGSISFDDVPVDGSSKMLDELMESIEPFDVSQGVDFNTAYLAGYLADKYDVAVDDCINRANDRIRNSALEAFRSTVNGYSMVTPVGANVNAENGCYKYALYPVWILNTTWNGEQYTFAMNGQTGKMVGDLPLDKPAFWKRIGLLTGIIGAIIYGLLWLIELL